MKFHRCQFAAVATGAAFLALSKIKYHLFGYTPRPSDEAEESDLALYEAEIVERWLGTMQADDPAFDLGGRSVLELGPGDSLGTGVVAHALGAARYTAYDVHALAARPRLRRYMALLDHVSARTGRDLSALRGRLADIVADPMRRDAAPLRFVCNERFDFSEFADAEFDVVVSNAAFEHFASPRAAIDALTRTCRPDARFYALVDLRTHSRWVCERDPLNIYRIPDGPYAALSTSATPNRVRPEAYADALTAAGWRDVRLNALEEADPNCLRDVRGAVLPRFRDDWLGCLILAVSAHLPEG